jgi:hypothetical protein
VLANFQNIIETPLPNQENYIAISKKIMKAHYMQYIVDLYGDAPYFEKKHSKVKNNTTPTNTQMTQYLQGN